MGEVLWLQEVAITQDYRPENGVFKLAHIARPIKALQHGQGLWRRTQDPLAFFSIDAGNEMFDQGWNIFHALAQRWRINWEDVQAVEQVFPEATFRNQFGQVLVRGSNDAHIHFDRPL